MIRSSCSFKMAPDVIEVCDFNPSMVPPLPSLSELGKTSARRPDPPCEHARYELIKDEEGRQDVSVSSALPQSQSNSCFVGVGTSVGVISGTGAANPSAFLMQNRKIVRYMCSSALILACITTLVLLLPLVLPPLPPPPAELMLLPVVILLLLVCLALSPRSPSLLPASTTSAPSSQSMPLPPLVHSLPLRSTMPC